MGKVALSKEGQKYIRVWKVQVFEDDFLLLLIARQELFYSFKKINGIP